MRRSIGKYDRGAEVLVPGGPSDDEVHASYLAPESDDVTRVVLAALASISEVVDRQNQRLAETGTLSVPPSAGI